MRYQTLLYYAIVYGQSVEIRLARQLYTDVQYPLFQVKTYFVRTKATTTSWQRMEFAQTVQHPALQQSSVLCLSGAKIPKIIQKKIIPIMTLS